MTRLSAGDQYLMDLIRQGNADGWSQLVQRYQGRLLAFARSQLNDPVEAEDLVQDVFLQFLQQVRSFRGDASLESFLFLVLRRRIIDHLRRRGRAIRTTCMLQESYGSAGESVWTMDQWPDDGLSASGRLIEQEQQRRQEDALRGSLEQLVTDLQRQCSFRDLQVLELIFYAQLRNKDIAELMEMNEKQVAGLKYRMIQRLSRNLGQGQGVAGPSAQQAEPVESPPLDESLLTRVWESLRPSCPKRTTLGKAVLGTLDEAWGAYVEFHLHRLGCRFCQANMADLALEADDRPPQANPLYDRILQSSVGFFRQ